VPAVQILLGRSLDKSFLKAVLVGAIMDLILNFSLVPFFSYIGSCTSVVITELFVTSFLYFEVIKTQKRIII
jgi:O-antigen/teichoic acid export membrane protein